MDKTHKQVRVLLFLKSIDGGTGSFALSLQKLGKFSRSRLHIETMVLEKPSYRKEIIKFKYYRQSNYYPQKYNFSLKNIIDFIRDFFWYRKQKQNLIPDIILGVDIHCNLIITIEKFLFPQPIGLILTTHINLEDTIRHKGNPFLTGILIKLISFLYGRADKLIAVSKGIRENLESSFNLENEIEVINYGLAKQELVRRKEYGKTKTILSIGRLVEQKDYFTLIKTFDLVQKEFGRARLIIAGNGPLKNELMVLIGRLGLAKKVSLVGWKQNVRSLVQKSNLFVLSTKREGFPYVLLEAMSYGLPVISSDAPFGPREILDGGKYGLLFPVGDVDKLKSAILLFLKDKKTNNHYSNQSYVRAKYYSLEKMLKNYSSIIEEVYNSSPRNPQNKN